MTGPTTPARRLRRCTSGAALVLFPALLVVEAPLDPASGGTGEVMYRAATEHAAALTACGGEVVTKTTDSLNQPELPAAAETPAAAASETPAAAEWALDSAARRDRRFCGGYAHPASGACAERPWLYL